MSGLDSAVSSEVQHSRLRPREAVKQQTYHDKYIASPASLSILSQYKNLSEPAISTHPHTSNSSPNRSSNKIQESPCEQNQARLYHTTSDMSYNPARTPESRQTTSSDPRFFATTSPAPSVDQAPSEGTSTCIMSMSAAFIVAVVLFVGRWYFDTTLTALLSTVGTIVFCINMAVACGMVLWS